MWEQPNTKYESCRLTDPHCCQTDTYAPIIQRPFALCACFFFMTTIVEQLSPSPSSTLPLFIRPSLPLSSSPALRTLRPCLFFTSESTASARLLQLLHKAPPSCTVTASRVPIKHSTQANQINPPPPPPPSPCLSCKHWICICWKAFRVQRRKGHQRARCEAR